MKRRLARRGKAGVFPWERNSRRRPWPSGSALALTAERPVTAGAPPTPYRRRLHRPSRMTRGHSFRYGSMRAIAPGCRAWLHGRMGFRKTYVDVVANIDVDGRVTPLSIRWRDGRTFEIDRVHEAIRRASTRVGGTGIRYLVTFTAATSTCSSRTRAGLWKRSCPRTRGAPRLRAGPASGRMPAGMRFSLSRSKA